MRTSKFQKGSTCYDCRICGKKTRETGDSESFIRLCRHCSQISGDENSVADGHMTVEEFREIWGQDPS